MRIIRGKNRGRQINPPKSFAARPTTDMAKEALFNVLEINFDFANSVVLDLFSGTGSISYEFASRGCNDITAVELSRFHADFIRKTTKELDFNIYVAQYDVFKYVSKIGKKFNIIFADPPYDLPNIEILPDLIFDNQLLDREGWFILEHSPTHDFTKNQNFIKLRNYGKVNFSFFELKTVDNEIV